MVGLGRFLHIAVRGVQPPYTDVPASRRPRQGHRSALVLYFRTYRATRRTIAGDSTAYQSRDYGFTDTDTYASIVVLVECPKPCVYMSCCAHLFVERPLRLVVQLISLGGEVIGIFVAARDRNLTSGSVPFVAP